MIRRYYSASKDNSGLSPDMQFCWGRFCQFLPCQIRVEVAFCNSAMNHNNGCFFSPRWVDWTSTTSDKSLRQGPWLVASPLLNRSPRSSKVQDPYSMPSLEARWIVLSFPPAGTWDVNTPEAPNFHHIKCTPSGDNAPQAEPRSELLVLLKTWTTLLEQLGLREQLLVPAGWRGSTTNWAFGTAQRWLWDFKIIYKLHWLYCYMIIVSIIVIPTCGIKTGYAVHQWGIQGAASQNPRFQRQMCGQLGVLHLERHWKSSLTSCGKKMW